MPNVTRLQTVLCIVCLAVISMPATLAYTQTETVLYNFIGGPKDGTNASGLILDAAGNLYGTTSNGGTLGGGIAFEVSPSASGSWTETILHYFIGGTDGFEPTANLVLDAAGNLYGTTLEGGTGPCSMGAHKGCGTVFKLSPNGSGSWTETILYSFAGGTDGELPRSNLILDTAGNLYGTTSYGGTHLGCAYPAAVKIGCGTVFELLPGLNGVWTKKILHDFGGGVDGQIPYAGLVFDKSGNLYGTTDWGGPPEGCGGFGRLQSCSVVFELTPIAGKGWDEKLLPMPGYNIVANLAIDSEGNLYGAADSGGDCGNDYEAGCGEVWELSPVGGGQWNTYPVAQFCETSPSAVILDGAGNLYWTAGATYGLCEGSPAEVVESSPGANNTWINTILFEFTGSAIQGTAPSGSVSGLSGLIRDAAGNLYGTGGGGTHGKGVVYEITP
jgi:hypothetical protein